jgi:hypothetical protein
MNSTNNTSNLREFIRQSINKIAFDELRNHKANATSKTIKKEDSINEDEVDLFLFHGGRKPEIENKKNTTLIKENDDKTVQLTTTEIKDFENSFSNFIKNIPNATIMFDKQANGYSLVAYKRPDGIEMLASGTIDLGRNGKVVWSYSIQNGITVNAQNLKIDQANKTLFDRLNDNYNDFQKKWRVRLSLPSPEPKEGSNVEQAPAAALSPEANLSEPMVQTPGT